LQLQLVHVQLTTWLWVQMHLLGSSPSSSCTGVHLVQVAGLVHRHATHGQLTLTHCAQVVAVLCAQLQPS
jgi:hypothetical protein